MLTFIIPSIARRTLTRTIHSLIGQTNPNWLAIVVYDGFYSELPMYDPRVLFTWVYPKIGTGNAAAQVRGKGIAAVQSEWTAFVDDDDTLAPTAVQDIMDSIREAPAETGAIVFRMQEFAPGGRCLPTPDVKTAEQLNLGNVGISMCIRTKILQEIEWKSNWSEDFDLIQHLRKRNVLIAVDPKPIYRVRW